MKVLIELNRFSVFGLVVFTISVALYVAFISIFSEKWAVEELLEIDQRSIYSPEAQILMLPLAFALLVPDFIIRNIINYHEASEVGKHAKDANQSKQDTLADFEQMLSKFNTSTSDITKEEIES